MRLPHLRLNEHTKYISQETADQIFDCLADNHPEQFERIADVHDKGGDIHPVNIEDSYFSVVEFIFKNPSNFPSFSKTELAAIDLMFELRRRWLSAFGYPIPDIRGKPLALSPDGPFPESLAEKLIHMETKQAGLTQEDTDLYVDQYFLRNKKWCHIKGEAWRRGLIVFPLTEECRENIFPLTKIVPKDENENIWYERIGKLGGEVSERIRISVGYYSPEQLEQYFGITHNSNI